MQSSSLRPISGRIIVRRLDPETCSSGGIIIPEAAKEYPLQGRVVAVAEGVDGILPGDRVLHGKYAGTEVECSDGLALVLDPDDVLAVLEHDAVQGLTLAEQEALSALQAAPLPGWQEEERGEPEQVKVRREQTGEHRQDERVLVEV